MLYHALRAGALCLLLLLGACALGPQQQSPYLNNVPVSGGAPPSYDIKGLSTGILLESGT